MERLNPEDPAERLVTENITLIRQYLGEQGDLQGCEETFKNLFKEYGLINHNDRFHGTETLLYHQYIVMHSFNTLMRVLNQDLQDNDRFIGIMRTLFETLESRTAFGRDELRRLLTENPPHCSKNLQTLLFIATVFHDVGKLYNTQKWEKEFQDEKLLLRKFERHDEYGWFFFRMLASKNVEKIIDVIIEKTQEKMDKSKTLLLTAKEKDKSELNHKINVLQIDIFYLKKSRDAIDQFKTVLEEFNLTVADMRFIAVLIEHHQTLFNDPSMNYRDVREEKDFAKLKRYLVWSREKKLRKVGIVTRNRANDFRFYGLLLISLSDCNGTGFSDQTVEYAFKTYKPGDTFTGHHGEISIDAEFFGFLNYLYHNIGRADEDILKDWFGVSPTRWKQN